MAFTHARPARRHRRFSPLAWLLAAVSLRRNRRRLGALDRHLLKDIGLSETEARIEAERSLWDVPSHWRR
ncbi:MAG: DUF1127 domain-containing protein [Albidovulum sp.]